ncbi:MAG: ABC transporter ATP-binding protein/permease [Lachnospiraceae bacterium]|jgi:ATP-binding cassette subfamily B protein|nr:ABC transporter ATP-binding protein/permease [Lachnospiraceae bacterium]MCH4027782.1 ABC transporter ATP-binding protein/permease [Lachnospiraceae bacterium]MCH4065624.1 ABC transporter ATP-binding protein/permease [Lachnospiraceae bacterium]MCH4111662.1 ABC transporter ATP-binding protein/permease [Lachnospiraceae bacterium]MCI1353388.1 ABC transporter ATP-binding protein/permease [Lachnospiraceae bacterium]
MEEQEEYKNLHLRLFGIPKIIPYVRPYLKKIVWMVIFGVVASLIDSIYPLLNSYILNHYVVRQTLDTLPWFLLTALLIVAVQSADNFVTTYWCGQVEMSVDRDLRNAAFNHLQTLSFSYFSRNNVGYIHARVMSDTGKIGEMMAWRIMDLVWNSSYIIFVLVMMFLLNAKLAAAVALLLPAAVLLIAWFQKHLITLNRKIREINSRITGEFNEGITGAASIKSLVVEDKINRDFQEETKTMKSTSIRATHYSALLTSLVTMFSMIALAIVLWRGGILTMGGVLLVGTLSAFMSYAIGMIDPITNIINTISALIAIQVNIERLTNLLETQSDVSDTPEVIEKYGDTFHPKRQNFEPLYGDVEFRDVSFRYPDGQEMVLSHFNLKVPQGTNVAIVGETGAGKSTLVNLVCRFYEPTEGQVLIDGRDVRERSQLWLHSNIGYVLQTPHLFSGTVRENLRYGKPDATDEEIMEALRLVSAEDVVRRMENGLDSEVGEGGDMLSTGEKQLLSFARAILADPRILVLDEATASIDTVTEKKIQNAIAAVIKGRTSFVIAHRLSTIVDADVILVVHDGRIIERGTHRELMMKKGYYYNLYTRQYEDLAVDMA